MARNTETANSIGLVFHHAIRNQINLSSPMKVNGGEACLMVLEYIRK